jgi:hypothetical protein
MGQLNARGINGTGAWTMQNAKMQNEKCKM